MDAGVSNPDAPRLTDAASSGRDHASGSFQGSR